MQKHIQERNISFVDNEYVVIEAKQNDNKSRIINFSFVDNAEKYNFPEDKTNFSILFCEEYSNGEVRIPTFVDLANLKDNVLSFTLTKDMLKIAGLAKCEFVFCESVDKPQISETGLIADSSMEILSTQSFCIQIAPSHSVFERLNSSDKSTVSSLIELFTNVKDTIAHVVSLDKIFSDKEQVRQDKEAERLSQETARNESENIRVKSEQLRIQNETARQEAESKRVTAEKQRVSEFNSVKADVVAQAKYAKEQGDRVKNIADGNLPVFKGATSTTDGTIGGIPQPLKGDESKALLGDGEWHSGNDISVTFQEFNINGTYENDTTSYNTTVLSRYFSYNSSWLKSIRTKLQDLTSKLQNLVVNNLTTTSAGYALDARQGKILNDKFTEFENNHPIRTTTDREGNVGYIRPSDGKFILFKSQADIDSAVSDARQGDATEAEVLEGYTFTNKNGSNLKGGMLNLTERAPYYYSKQDLTKVFVSAEGACECSSMYDSQGNWVSEKHIGICMDTYGYIEGGSIIAVPASEFGNATKENVLNTKYFSSSEGHDIQGSMPNNGAWGSTINPSGSVTIPKGYHDGTGKVTANANQNSGTYTFPANSTGAKYNMGVNNTIQWVDATNVYAKGKTDGANSKKVTGVSGDRTGTMTQTCTCSVNNGNCYIVHCNGGIKSITNATMCKNFGSETWLIKATSTSITITATSNSQISFGIFSFKY